MFRKITMLVLVFVFLAIIATSASADPYISFSLNRYTQKEDNGHTNYPFNANIPASYTKVAENTNVTLYVDFKTLALKIQNNKTGYVWSTVLDNAQNSDFNEEWLKRVLSPVGVYMFDETGKTKIHTLLDDDVKMAISNINNGVKANIEFKDEEVAFSIYVRLTQSGVNVEIPDSTIVDRKNILASIQMFPFMGAVRQNEILGYIFIPDGPGALIRFGGSDFQAQQPYLAKVYGNDPAINYVSVDTEYYNPPKSIYLPVYGMVHGTKQNAYFVNIQNGAEYATIFAYPAGLTTNYYWVGAEFDYRENYFQPTSKEGDVVMTYPKERNKFDIKMDISILGGQDADYVGMAKAYRSYLESNGILGKKDDGKSNIPLRIELLGAESKRVLFWRSTVNMTTVSEASAIINDMLRNGLDNMLIIYKGITAGGYTGTQPMIFPFNKSLGAKNEFIQFFEKYSNANLNVSIYADYLKAYKGADGYTPRTDTITRITGELLKFDDKKENKEFYYLLPSVTLNRSEEDLTELKEYNIKGLAVDGIGYILSSAYGEEKISRIASAQVYADMLNKMSGEMDNISLYTPNSYLLKYVDNYLDIPLYSSEYVYETDTVPFMQIVLKGYVNYFSPFLNFSSNLEEDVLRNIEYGSYPSFILTYQPSYKLMDTASEDIFTSEYGNWSDTIKEIYDEINGALKYVKGETIEDREVLENQIVKVTYSNGVAIIVNYSDTAYTYGDQSVPAKGYLIREVE
ncbi:DUF5696 domain-containing protein [Mahella sp.]|uniref:DUF5696 domain-containing protein n=1 Tax=Mahella sp. TaxID=2798721 RepID=UPI0025BD796A|nr:DUF5696 domain-containing protein [Mahella sp.]MBZ4665289.1 hypothetical protein [Mahella sp.]